LFQLRIPGDSRGPCHPRIAVAGAVSRSGSRPRDSEFRGNRRYSETRAPRASAPCIVEAFAFLRPTLRDGRSQLPCWSEVGRPRSGCHWPCMLSPDGLRHPAWSRVTGRLAPYRLVPRHRTACANPLGPASPDGLRHPAWSRVTGRLAPYRLVPRHRTACANRGTPIQAPRQRFIPRGRCYSRSATRVGRSRKAWYLIRYPWPNCPSIDQSPPP
jgi:hypothetical protein